MGLINALAEAASGVLGDQWREYFYCESIPKEILITKGVKKTGKYTSNKFGRDNIISNGSIIAVNSGQCMIIVEQGKVVDICAEPGEYIYDISTEPSVFFGDLGESIRKSFANIGKRFTFGGDAPKDQRVYYVNIKELIDNKYGTPNPVPFRVVDKNIGLDMDISIRCFGEYSYKIADPVLFYTNVCGNIKDSYGRKELDGQLKSEFLTSLQPAFGRLSQMGIRYSELMLHTNELAEALNENLSKKWGEIRGLQVVSVGISSLTPDEGDEEMIKELQRTAAFRDPTMAAARLADAQAEAMQNAAANEGAGAAMAFMGLGMANAAAGGVDTQGLYKMGAEAKNGIHNDEEDNDQWTCKCGATKNKGRFCTECGNAKPSFEGWNCDKCGALNKGKFCSECGSKKPDGELVYKCDKCGWEPDDPKNPPKFCPECGDIFNDDDAVK